MATPKKINPNAQAPRLIEQIISELDWTQKKLEGYLKISQQSVSNYRRGRVGREQHEVIQKLETIWAKRLLPPTAEEVIDHVQEKPDVAQVKKNAGKGAKSTKKAGLGVVSPRRSGRRYG